MRIWIVIAYDPVPEIDTGARILRYGTLAQTFRQAGHEVVFWTSTFDHAAKKNRYLGDQRVVFDARYAVQFLHAPKYSKNSSLKRILHYRIIADTFLHLARVQERPDIIFAGIPSVELTQAAVAYGLEFQVPVVVDAQDLWPDIYLTVFPRAFRRIARSFLRYQFAQCAWACRHASAITAVSRTYLKWGLRNAGRNARLADGVFCLGSVDPLASGEVALADRRAYFGAKHGISAEKIQVVFLGQFGRSYDLATVLRAADITRGRGSERVNYLLIGGGDQDTKLRRLAKGMGNVQFLGWLQAGEATGVLANCAIGLAAYTERATQSLPYKPFEYMAMGLPVLSSLKGELRSMIEAERFGFHYQAGNPNSLADAVQNLAEDEAYRLQAGSRARCVFKRDFDMSTIYPRLMEHLQRVAIDGLDS